MRRVFLFSLAVTLACGPRESTSVVKQPSGAEPQPGGPMTIATDDPALA